MCGTRSQPRYLVRSKKDNSRALQFQAGRPGLCARVESGMVERSKKLNRAHESDSGALLLNDEIYCGGAEMPFVVFQLNLQWVHSRWN
jgi:hypothetical protein